MDGIEIINSIGKIYDRFNIPSNLRMHMLRAASVGEFICDSAKIDAANRSNIVGTLLIHDLGNIVKFKFDSYNTSILGAEAKRIDYWKGVKEEVITKYGSEDHTATNNMARELGINDRIRFLVENNPHIEYVESSQDLSLKICIYSDSRVSPSGVVSVQERFIDLVNRYDHSKIRLLEKNRDLIVKIEKQIIEATNLRPEQITDESISPYLENYLAVI